MPYDPNRSGEGLSEADEGEACPLEQCNPFLQFVDPSTHQQLVERALNSADGGRLITPLSRVHSRKSGERNLDGAWDEELADDAA